MSYSASVSVAAGGSTNWTTPGLGAFSFSTSASGYLTSSQDFTVNANTQSLQLCVTPARLLLDVRDRFTDLSISVSAQVSWSGFASGSIFWAGGQAQEFEHSGFGSYNFVAVPSAFYQEGTLTFVINAQSTIIIIYVDPNPVQIDVRAEDTQLSVTFAVSITYSGQASGSIAWNGLQQWSHGGYGNYFFTAVPSTTDYATGELTVQVDQQTSIIVIILPRGIFCGDGDCNGNEDYDFCPQDCLGLILEMEDAAGFGPVNDVTVNYFGNQNPRTPDQANGPNRNGIPADKTRTAVPGSNIISELTYTRGTDVYFESVTLNFINFYWIANSSDSRAVSAEGIYKLRVHLSALLQSSNKNYRFVNTWKPIDAPPEPYGPTDLNLHLFHPAGALDINTKTLTQDGFEIGNSVADSKQSGGPATMDISPGGGQMVAVWNSKPPRSSAITPSQNGRYIIHSGSYIVLYGKTANAAQGKQLGQFVLNQYLAESDAAASDTTSDLWYAGQMTVRQSGVNQPDVISIKKLKSATIEANRDMVFDCEAYGYCAAYRVPYSDSGKRDE